MRYIGVSNETSYGVMRFAQLAEQLGLPKIVSIQNSYSLLVCVFSCSRPAFDLIKARHGASRCVETLVVQSDPCQGMRVLDLPQ